MHQILVPRVGKKLNEMIILPPTGAVVVVADMSLAMVSVFFNLVVITSIRKRREKERQKLALK